MHHPNGKNDGAFRTKNITYHSFHCLVTLANFSHESQQGQRKLICYSSFCSYIIFPRLLKVFLRRRWIYPIYGHLKIRSRDALRILLTEQEDICSHPFERREDYCLLCASVRKMVGNSVRLSVLPNVVGRKRKSEIVVISYQEISFLWGERKLFEIIAQSFPNIANESERRFVKFIKENIGTQGIKHPFEFFWTFAFIEMVYPNEVYPTHEVTKK